MHFSVCLLPCLRIRCSFCVLFSRTKSFVIISLAMCVCVCVCAVVYESGCTYLLASSFFFPKINRQHVTIKTNHSHRTEHNFWSHNEKRKKTKKSSSTKTMRISNVKWWSRFFFLDFVCSIVKQHPRFHVWFDGNCFSTACGVRFGSTFPPKTCRRILLMVLVLMENGHGVRC